MEENNGSNATDQVNELLQEVQDRRLSMTSFNRLLHERLGYQVEHDAKASRYNILDGSGNIVGHLDEQPLRQPMRRQRRGGLH